MYNHDDHHILILSVLSCLDTMAHMKVLVCFEI